MIVTKYQAHPSAEIFPLMEGAEFDALVADIKEHGLREPIILHDGMILDGRNRHRACVEIGLPPKFQPWNGEGTPEAFVVSMNLHRRHLNESQRAMIAARLATLKHGDIASQRDDKPIGVSTVAEAARLMNVGTSSVARAKRVIADGTAEEIQAIERGEASVGTTAERIYKGRSPQQRKTKRAESLAQSGKNPERIERIRIRAEVWGRVRDALINLTSLPAVPDVVRIVREMDRAGLVDAKLDGSLQWLTEFSDEWRNRDQTAA